MVDVVTLAQDIEENQKITEEDLQFQTLPKIRFIRPQSNP